MLKLSFLCIIYLHPWLFIIACLIIHNGQSKKHAKFALQNIHSMRTNLTYTGGQTTFAKISKTHYHRNKIRLTYKNHKKACLYKEGVNFTRHFIIEFCN